MLFSPQQPPQRDYSLAYLITDNALIVREVGETFFLAEQRRGALVGQPLLQLLPELASAQSVFHAILSGKMASHIAQLTPPDPANASIALAVEYSWLRTQAHRNNQGEIIGLIHWQETATGQQELQKELQTLREQVEIFQHMLDMIAHDLSTPVTLLSGYLELLTASGTIAEESDTGEYIRAMTGTVGRLLPMIDGLYDLAHAVAGRLRLNRRPVNLGDFLHDLVLEFRPKFASRNQQVLVEVVETLPEVTCDMVRFAQIVNNLFGNASKYSPEHSQIHVRAVLTEPQEHVQISVSDSGSGIASIELDNIFKRHYRTPSAERSPIRGAGLGLYIARLLVELHGGRIWCESTPGVGSTFHFTIPVRPVTEDAWFLEE